MANKKISELQTRTPSLSDLILVGDPSNGFSYKCTVSALATIIETDIADGYVTLGTTQTISGAKTFSNNLTLTSVANASTDPDKFLVLNGSNVVNYRTGSEVLSDIGGQGTITLTTTGTSGAATFSANTLNIPQYQGVITLTTTGTSGAATLVGNTLNIPNYAPDLSGYVPTSRTITINGTTQDLTANRTYNVGTVTSVAASGGTGISISGSPITSSGTITITNTAPDQVVALTAGTGISISGTYPNFTITNSSPSLGGTVTSVALSAPTGFAVTGSPITSSGTLALAFASGYSLPTTASQTNWDSAYNNMIVSAAVTGTTTKTLTLTQQDAGTITASWTDDNTDAVTSVFGRTGAVVATEGDYSLTQLSDVTITTPSTGQVLKYNGTIWVNDTDANTGTVTSVALSAPTGFSVSGSPITSSGTLALSFASGYSLPTNTSQSNWDTAYTNRITSLTTSGSSGAATLISNTLNIPTYTLTGLGGISLTSLSAFVPLVYNNTTGQFSITQASGSNDGYLSATDWTTFNNKQATITLTTTGTSGAATFTSNTLNIPQYQGALTLTTTGTSGAATLVGNTLNIPQYSGGGGSVSGTTNYIAKFTSSTAVGDSQLFDNGTNVGVATATAGSKLQVNGNAAIGYSASTAAPTNGLAVSGNLNVGTTTSVSKVNVSDKLRLWDATPTGASISNVMGYMFNTSSVPAGSFVEDVGTGIILSYGVNTPQAGTRTTSVVGGIFRLDTRSTQQEFTVIGLATGGSTEAQRIGINLQNGNTILAPAAGNVGVGISAYGTMGSKLQVNGNAAIGYSASTAAPTNGLAVAGNAGFGTNSSGNFNGISFTGPFVDVAGILQVKGTSANTIAAIQLGGDTFRKVVLYSTIGTEDPAFGIGISSSGSTSAGSDRFRINSSGVVFVGNGETAGTPNTGIISATGGTGTNIAGAEFRIRGGASTGSGAGGPITFYTSAAGSSGTGVNAATERMRITNAGNVGIGTSSPASPLSLSGSGDIGMRIKAGGANLSYIDFDEADSGAPNGSIAYNNGTNAMTFSTGGSNTERMRITSGGNLGIGTTTIGSTLQVNGNVAIGYSASTSAPTNGLIVAGNAYFGGQIASLTDVMQLKGSGNVLIAMQSTVNTQFSGMNLYNEAGTLAASFALGNSNTGSFSNNFFLGPRTASGNLLFVTGASGTTRMTMTTNGELQFTPATNTSVLSTTGSYSLTGSNASSLIDLAGTWNTTGNPTAIKLNITNTASGANADLMELQVGGVNQFVVTKAGNILLGGSITTENPTGGTKKAWKLGSVVVTGSWVIDSSRYVEVEIDGTAYKLALAIAP